MAPRRNEIPDIVRNTLENQKAHANLAHKTMLRAEMAPMNAQLNQVRKLSPELAGNCSMPTLMRKIATAFATLTFVMPLSYAEQMGNSDSGGHRLSREWGESIKRDTLDGAVVGFGLGSLMSSGNAQQAVDQEPQRKKEAARKKTAAKESATKTSGETGKGTTASGTRESRSPTRQASEHW